MKPVTASILISGLSAAAVAFLFWLIYFFELKDSGLVLPFLPALNATCNALSATAIGAGLVAIRKSNYRAHGICMVTALFASSCFLVGYLIHHALHGDTQFAGQGWTRPVYFTLLISHILLSVIALPLVLNAAYFAATRSWTIHRKIARWALPIWLYVSVTGVLVFFFLRVWFPS